ncbi:hypothetical protein GCM10023168_27150 [Fodinibacter luteus]|uniref:R3H domain-containing protein n=1 Tax=Fodinibacter luteus TaxID=552064 RepID=A0ABP8KLI4_9MICO
MSENLTQEPEMTQATADATTPPDATPDAAGGDAATPDAAGGTLDDQSDSAPDAAAVAESTASVESVGSVESAESVESADGGETDDEEGTANAGSAPAPASRRDQLEREGEVAADFLETLLDICDLDGDIDVDIDGDRAAVSVVDSEDGRVPRRLVGQNGQVLDALQELTRLAVQSATGERSRLMLDVAGHRAERRASLVTLAREAIDEVRTTGERKPLTPMTAFERKVVHDEVLAAGLSSESEGSEPRRYVVILPA